LSLRLPLVAREFSRGSRSKVALLETCSRDCPKKRHQPAILDTVNIASHPCVRGVGRSVETLKNVFVVFFRAVWTDIVSEVCLQVRADVSLKEPPLLVVVSNLFAVHADRKNGSLDE
jgi:hypothetical protein